jgi:predicted TIM-barrel enzyme
MKPLNLMLMNASHELQKLVDSGVRFSLALEHNGWFAVRIGNYLTCPFAANYSPTFELAVAALSRAAFGWPMAS